MKATTAKALPLFYLIQILEQPTGPGVRPFSAQRGYNSWAASVNKWLFGHAVHEQ